MPLSTYLPDKMGTAVISPEGEFEAGSFQEFTLTYHAGYFGIDDTGSIKIVHRFASDMGRPQFTDPGAANYTTVEASNGAVLHVEYDPKRNIRPWDKTLYIKVVRGFLREGDRITVRFGDRRGGGPGIRVQTFCEKTFEFRVLVDAFATYDYVQLPVQPEISIVAGQPAQYQAIISSLRAVNQSFRLRLKGVDRWGNPSNLCKDRIQLTANLAVSGLPSEIQFTEGKFAHVIEPLIVKEQGDLVISLLNEQGETVARTNPCRFVQSAALLPYWGDLHGQSEETIGTNSAREFYEFARDKAFLDICVHQGNDFQITTEFWQHLNELSAEFNKDGSFITFPGWEWSGNTGLGGDRNVLLMSEGRPIHRSSHALVTDHSDIADDANSADILFANLKDEDCVVFAHIGGRYADIKMSHDQHLERAVEVHSAWGTFEWLVHDAFEQGYRVGIVANSDGHKGRPGASHPGATKFGAYGGLTCVLSPEFSRAGIMSGLRKRHHYATTGNRCILDTCLKFEQEAELLVDYPEQNPKRSKFVKEAMMGDVLRSRADQVQFCVNVHGSAPVERIDVRNGLETIKIFRPYSERDLGRRIRVIWEGSEYRGRGRETIWDGSAELTNNQFECPSPINYYNLDKKFEQSAPNRIEWTALTTGGFGGFDALLTNPSTGTLKIQTNLVKQEIPVSSIGSDEQVFSNGGIDRRIRIFRLPDVNAHFRISLERNFSVYKSHDNAFYVRVTFEDGNVAWSSPIYIID